MRYVPLSNEVARQLDIDQTAGAYVAESTPNEPAIVPNSPAAKAGLRSKDIIIAIDGVKIGSRTSLTTLLGQHAVGDEVSLTILRDGKTITVPVTLAAAE